MNEQLQQELVAWLVSLRETGQSASNFAIEQAPLTVREYITWQRTEATVWVIGALIVIVVACAIFRRALRRPMDAEGYTGVALLIMAPSGACVLAGITVFCANLSWLLQAWMAPRVLVLQWIASLLK